MKKKKVIFVLGPTAVGKSDVAVRLAKDFSGEIISADSVQIFRGLDVGSAKITKEEMKSVPHFGIDILDATERFSAFEFVKFAKEKISKISARQHLPIMVGGTGLFVKSLVEGYNFGSEEGSSSEEETKRHETAKAEAQKIMAKGLDFAFEKLCELDYEASKEIDRFNPERVKRALEIAIWGGKKSKHETDIEPLIFALNMPREKIYKRIDLRVDKMLESGLVDEVKGLLENGVPSDAQSMRAIGYKEVVSFLNGEISYERMVELVKQHSRNYAKRQITFIKKMPCVWVDMTEKDAYSKIVNKVKDFLTSSQ